MPKYMLEVPVVRERARSQKRYDGHIVPPLEMVDLLKAARAVIAEAAHVAFPKGRQGHIMIGVFHGDLSLTERAQKIAQARGKESGKHWRQAQMSDDIAEIAEALHDAIYYPEVFAARLTEANEIARDASL